MCRGCGKVKYTSPSQTFGRSLPSGYRTETEVLVVYNGERDLRVTGCRSGNRYWFASGRVRHVDVNDAPCLVTMQGFEYA